MANKLVGKRIEQLIARKQTPLNFAREPMFPTPEPLKKLTVNEVTLNDIGVVYPAPAMVDQSL